MLESSGCDVATFSRGPLESTEHGATGPVTALHENPYLSDRFDAVVNYIFLQNESVGDNLAYVDSLLKFCAARKVKHLIHISSCSVYPNHAKHIDETVPAETDPRTKGPYGAVKVAAESFITSRLSESMKVSMIRPGIVLGLQMGGFMGGIALRLPTNALLGLGNADSQMPVVERAQMNRVIARLIASPPESAVEPVLLAAPNSPTRREYIDACCDVLGAGSRSFWLPTPVWLAAAGFGELVLPLVGKRGTGVYSKVRSVCRYQRYSVAATEKRVGESLQTDWRTALARSFTGTERNYHLPEAPRAQGAPASVSFLGFGRIVKQRYLPALRRLGFSGRIDAFDLAPREDSGVTIQDIHAGRPAPAALHVVATPGPAHIEAAGILEGIAGRILVEKPLGYTRQDVAQWLAIDAARPDGVYCCHSSRYRRNVIDMLAHLRRYNSGRLIHAQVEFQSPPVAWDPAPWLRAERRSATLLLDYGIHLLDIASMFAQGEPELCHCSHQLNGNRETESITGSAAFENYTVDFVLRQGLFPRKASVRFTFRHYSVHLGFSPDVFVPVMTDDNFGRSLKEARRQITETGRKAIAALTGRDSDRAHDHVIAGLSAPDEATGLRVMQLKPVYELLFAIKDRVYIAP